MQKLVQGLQTFQTRVFESRRGLFENLAQGQKPPVLFITCSDSRVDPGLFTQADPGDLFVLRNAGNIIPPYGAGYTGEAATIEYAVVALGIDHIVVCGHSHCGAMKGLLHPESLSDLPAVAGYLANAEATRRIVRDHYGHLDGEAKLSAAVQENVLVQLDNLRTHPTVASRLARGDLNLYGWVYKFETGQVFDYDPDTGQFAPMAGSAPRSIKASARAGRAGPL